MLFLSSSFSFLFKKKKTSSLQLTHVTLTLQGLLTPLSNINPYCDDIIVQSF